jgi:hypothetical protein
VQASVLDLFSAKASLKIAPAFTKTAANVCLQCLTPEERANLERYGLLPKN